MIEQRTPEWFEARCGLITASRMHDVMAFTAGEGVWKSGPRKGQQKVATPLKAREDYANQLAAERITGKSREQIKARSLQWGIDVEPAAVAAYEARTGVITAPGGFHIHRVHSFIGASPDFLVGTSGGGEIKCPESQDVHLATRRNGLPPEHVEQIQGGLWVTGREWWDFVSFHPNFPQPICLFVLRVERDEEYIARLAEACLSLNEQVEQIVAEQMRQCA